MSAESEAPERYAGFEAELAAHEKRQQELRAAAAAPLPGPLREAFAGDPPRLHGFTLQPVTAGLVAVLVRIDSPLLAVVRLCREHAGKPPDELERMAAESIQPDPEAMVETVFCFVTGIKALRALLGQGRAQFREAAMESVGDKLHPSQLAELEMACGAHFARSFATVVMHQPRPGPGTVFTPPPAETASAGGSISSDK